MIDSDEQTNAVDLSLYGGEDPRDRPRYSYPETARATGVPTTTIAAWVRGQDYVRKHGTGRFEPVIRRPATQDSRLSFNNLIEVHALRALRTVHEVRLRDIRTAIDNAEREFGIERLLIHKELRTSGRQLFLDNYFRVVQLSPSAQIAMRSILKQFLARVDFDERRLAAEFFPFGRSGEARDKKLLRVSPFISFGQPVIARVGVSTRVIADRINAGEDKVALMKDYGIKEPEFEEAILYEAAA